MDESEIEQLNALVVLLQSPDAPIYSTLTAQDKHDTFGASISMCGSLQKLYQAASTGTHSPESVYEAIEPFIAAASFCLQILAYMY